MVGNLIQRCPQRSFSLCSTMHDGGSRTRTGKVIHLIPNSMAHTPPPVTSEGYEDTRYPRIRLHIYDSRRRSIEFYISLFTTHSDSYL